MNLRSLFFLILVLSDTGFARPIPNDIRRRSISIQWRKYLPTLGALGILGGLVGLIVLGTKADEAYNAAKVVTESEAEVRFSSLSPNTQEYLVRRLEFIGEKNLPQSQKESVEAQDLLHGWPPSEMPDTRGMDRSTRQKLKSAFKNYQRAMGKVEITQKLKDKALVTADQADTEHKEAKFHAALIAATEWKEAYEKAKGQLPEVNITS